MKFTPATAARSTCRAPSRATRRRSTRPRHRHRHRRGRAGARSSRPSSAAAGGAHEHGGHRPRPHAVQADRRPARRPAVDGERARRGQHVRVLHPASSPGAAAPTPAADRRSESREDAAPAASWSSRTTAASAELLRSTSRAPGYAVAVARDGVEGLELARRLAPSRGRPRHPAAAARTAGTCSRGSRATPHCGHPGGDRLDARRAGRGLRARRRRVPRQAGRSRDDLLGALAPLRPAARRRPHAGGDRRRPASTSTCVEAVLAPEGWRVLRATGGEEGVRARRGASGRPSCCSTCSMPDIDGFEVVEHAPRGPATARRPDRRADVEGHDAAPTASGSPARSASSRGRARSTRRPSSPISSARVAAPASRGGIDDAIRQLVILIVEDNERNLKLARDVLEHVGLRHARGRDRRGRARARPRASIPTSS